MKKQKFYIVDVFAEQRFAGTPLAVLPNAQGLSGEDMLAFAKEFNFSETAFITSGPEEQNAFTVRIFTPKKEIPFAAHPLLGTASVINKGLLDQSKMKINLALPAGPFTVSIEQPENQAEIFWMKQPEPEFGKILPPELIAEIIGLSPVDIHPNFPVQTVSTDNPQIVVPVASPDALSNIAINVEKYRRLIEQSVAKVILVFCGHGTDKSVDATMRVFPGYSGITEDPATGSGAGCLAGYLIKHNYYKTENINLKVGQGREINRPSLLHIRAKCNGNSININVGGSVIEVAEGDLISAS